jgi:hypothetical protein
MSRETIMELIELGSARNRSRRLLQDHLAPSMMR